jgi:hypothetical protein
MQTNTIQGYTLLLEGVPLLVDEDITYGGRVRYSLNRRRGMPYIVDRETLQMYCSYGCDHHWEPNKYSPSDTRDLAKRAQPASITVSASVTNGFSFSIDCKPLEEPLPLYPVLPITQFEDTLPGLTEGTIIKVSRNGLGLEVGMTYISDDIGSLLTYIGIDNVSEKYYYYLFQRSGRLTGTFYNTINMTAILSTEFMNSND